MSTTPPPPSQQPGPPVGGTPYPAQQGPGGKLDTAGTFERIFQVYGAQFVVLIGTALAVFLPITLLSAAAASSGSALLVLAVVVIGVIGQALYTGTVVKAVEDIRDGRRDFSIADLLRAAAPFIFPLILGGFLFGILFAIGLILLIIPGLVFFTWFCLFMPSMVIERRGVFAAFDRSRELVRGNGWRVFGVAVMVLIINFVVSAVLQRVGHSAGDYVGSLIGGLIANVLTAPIFALALSVVYFQLRDLQGGTQGLSGPAPPPRV